MTGLVQSFDADRGFGFIKPLIGKPNEVKNVFVHVSQVAERKPLPVGAEVRFDLVRGEQGPQAANVTLRHLRGNVLLETGS